MCLAGVSISLSWYMRRRLQASGQPILSWIIPTAGILVAMLSGAAAGQIEGTREGYREASEVINGLPRTSNQIPMVTRFVIYIASAIGTWLICPTIRQAIPSCRQGKRRRLGRVFPLPLYGFPMTGANRTAASEFRTSFESVRTQGVTLSGAGFIRAALTGPSHPTHPAINHLVGVDRTACGARRRRKSGVHQKDRSVSHPYLRDGLTRRRRVANYRFVYGSTSLEYFAAYVFG